MRDLKARRARIQLAGEHFEGHVGPPRVQQYYTPEKVRMKINHSTKVGFLQACLTCI